MRALVYHGPDSMAWEEVDKPTIDADTDAIVRVDATTICGTDLHILKGDVPAVTDGRILGHEAVGTVESVGTGVSDEDLLMLSDILPTGYEVGVLNGGVQPGDVVAVVGAGPIGLSAIMGSRLYSPAHVVAIDLADSRLEAAKAFGADVTVNNGREDPHAVLAELTGGLGADVTIEAVGVPATFELAAALVRPGGRVANIGVHGEPVTLHLEEMWIKDVTITMGLVDTFSTPTLLRLLQGDQLDANRFATRHFDLAQIEEAYDVFGRAADTGALKVILNRS